MLIEEITENDLPSLAQLYQQLIPHEPDLTKMINTLRHIRGNHNSVILGAK